MVVELLQQTDLLTDDLPTDLSGFWIAQQGSLIVGVAGIEEFGHTGLLRSVAVHPDYRNQHIARQLLDQLLTEARIHGLTSLYLITTTAPVYFERYGFATISRTTVPEAIRQTRQFSELCPASATAMHKLL